ncbi:MAG: HlyC/CorC family transporter [Ruminiclostridium sp.]|nr:HlyC/CorC family transporter [Ruminiclostridium sp.]
MDSDARKPGKAVKILLSPLILLNKGLDKLLSKALGESYYDKDDTTQDNIMSMVDAGNEYGNLEDESAQLINNVFEFGDLVASDVMTHRKNIVGVEINSSLDDIVYIALEKGFSRIPVFKDSIDAIVGIIIVKDLLCLVGNDNKDNLKIDDFLREAVYVPESCSCSDAFKFLTNLKSGMGVVIDEYGGTAGIITLEDIIESIMGNIEDEYDEERELIIRRSGGAYEIDGEADPEEVLELFGYELEDNHEYDTIAGFVTDLLGYIPEEEGEHPKVRYKDIIFKVIEVHDNCISKLIVRPCKEDELKLEQEETTHFGQ